MLRRPDSVTVQLELLLTSVLAPGERVYSWMDQLTHV